MKGRQPVQTRTVKPRIRVDSYADESYDFSEMSLDELLDSVRRDIEPQIDEKDAVVIKEAPTEARAPAIPYIAPRSRRWDEPADYANITPSRRRRFGFYKVLLLILVLMIAAICVGAVYFWRYIDAYEVSLPEHVIQSLQDNINYNYWVTSVEEAITPRLTEFEKDVSLSSAPFISKIKEEQFTIRQKSDESTDETLVYIVRAGARDIGIIRLIPGESAGYGFVMWEVGGIELINSYVDALARTISITASHNAQVEVNGIPVSMEYSTECDVEYGATYTIDGIFGDVEVTVVEFNGQKSSPYYAENGEYYYPVISPFSRKYSFIVPEDAEVLINGQRVPPGSNAGDRIMPEILEEVVDPEESPLYSIRYDFELDDLYEEPVLRVVNAEGVELFPTTAPDGGILYTEEYSDEYKEQYSATVEAFIRAYVRFGANIGNSAETNFANLSGYMLRGSELYRRTQASIEGIIWVSGTTVEYNSLEIDNFRPYGDNYFSCQARYNITNKTYYEAREVEGDYEILFVLSGGKWLAAKMVAL